jgi:two-component system, cell cycle sensor histidine kinase and response regulator CckA
VQQNFARKILEAGQQGQDVADQYFPQPQQELRPQKGRRVLLVEDQESVREMMIHMLTRMGLEVLSTVDGAEALSLLKEQDDNKTEPFAVIIADMDMPKIDGIALAERIKADYPDMKFMLLSGAQEGVLASIRASRPYIHAVLRKPVSRAQMEQRLAEILNFS